MKVKDETHHGRVKTDEPKEEPATTVRCPFGDMRPPFLKLRFYNLGGITPSMAGGKNILVDFHFLGLILNNGLSFVR